MEVKLYVGNLPAATTEKALRQLFSQAGTVTAVHLLSDREGGQNKGFAHVSMATHAEAQEAVSRFHEFDFAGRQLTVTLARTRPAAAGYQSKLGAFGAGDPGQKPNTRKPGTARGGYQSKLGPNNGQSAPTPPRRRGGSQRH